MLCRKLLPTLLCSLLLISTGAAAAIDVTGRILVPGETPLAEAEVLLLPLTDPLTELQREASGRPEPEPIRTLTDSAGRFVLEAPRAGLWRVRVQAAGFVPLEAELRPLIEPTVLEDARLTPDVGLSVRVTDPEGRPVTGASVVVVADRGSMRFGRSVWESPRGLGVTAEDGTVDLASSERTAMTISVHASGYPVRELEGHRGTAARVRLTRGIARELHVISADDLPVEGALVAIGDQPHAIGVSDAEGRLKIDVKGTGTFDVSAIHTDGRRASTRLGPAGTDPGRALRLMLPERLSLVGRLIDAESRRAIPDGVVWDVRNTDRAVLSDPAGGFVLGGPAGSRLELTAGAPGYLRPESFDFQLEDDGRPGPTLALRPAAAIAGRVVDDDGEAVAGAEVELAVRRTPGRMRIEIGGSTAVPRALSGPRGEFRIGSIDPDENYDVKVTAEGFAPAEQAVTELEPYRTRSGLRITLGRGHVLTGTVVDEEGVAISGASVEAKTASPSGGGHMIRIMEATGGRATFEAVSDDEGRFEIRGIPTGKFDLEASRKGYARRTLPGIELRDDGPAVDVGEIALPLGETLEGYVRDADGQPIEGVEIFASESGGGMMMVMAGPGGGGGKEEPDTLTDPAGWFMIGDLARDERYSLEARRTGFVGADAGAVGLPQTEPLVITMDPASDVSGTVLDPQAEPIVGARVMLRRTRTIEMGGNVMAMMMMSDSTTDQEGRFLFEDQEPGTISLSAVASGYQEAKRDNIEVPKGQDLENVEIPLPAGAILEGRVLMPDGRAAIGATLGPVGEGEGPVDMTRMMSRVGVDGNGYYRIEGLEPGAISIEAEHPDYPRVVRDTELREGRNSLDLGFQGGHEVGGRVIDSSGAPVEEAAVRLVPAGRSWGGPESRSLADGSFVMPGVQDGDYRLWVDAQGFASFDGKMPVQVDGGPVQGLEVQLDPGGAIFGRITGLEPEQFSDVGVSSDGPGMAGFGDSDVDYEGNYRIEHLTAGSYTLTARLRDSGKQASGQVTLEPGATEARLDLQFGGGLTLSGKAIQGEAPIAGATVFAEGVDIDHTGWSQTDHSGQFSIEGLEAGTYEVHVRNFQTGLAYSETLDLATSREITLELPTAFVGGRVLDSTDRDPLAGVTVILTDPRQTARASLPTHTTTTDLDGSFLISSVADGEWRLSASKKGYAAYAAPVAVQFDKSVDDLEITMDATEGLTVEARLPNGTPPDELSVAVLDASGGALFGGSYTTGEGGRVRLSSVPPGGWELVVSAAGAATANLSAQAPGPPVAVQLQPATELRVDVPDLTGTGALATVRLRDSAGRPFRALGWTAQPRSQWRMEAGRIEFASLPPGSWTVTVETADGRSWSGTSVTTPGAAATLSLE
jgi:protocatechuate 3,4-dioxygenase beta subunit